MRRITVKSDGTVTVAFTAREWDLFTCRPEAERIAGILNRELSYAISHGLNEDDVFDHMEFVMEHLPGFGASDTEPRAVLASVLIALFGTADDECEMKPIPIAVDRQTSGYSHN